MERWAQVDWVAMLRRSAMRDTLLTAAILSDCWGFQEDKSDQDEVKVESSKSSEAASFAEVIRSTHAGAHTTLFSLGGSRAA